MTQHSIYNDVLFGIAVGDALGVPVEFKPRSALKSNPVKTMSGYGTYNLPPGTWSDDSSLSLCLAEALLYPFDLNNIAKLFRSWLNNNHWTARGFVFDVGITTRNSINKLENGVAPPEAGGFDENDNGNGSLMRILPLLFYIKDSTVQERYQYTRLVSSITHGHIRSVLCCFYYLEFARLLLVNKNKWEVYQKIKTKFSNYLDMMRIDFNERKPFDRLLKSDISLENEKDIYSTGYVIHTLEASIWCILNSGSYKEAVLKAVNLGEDSDTTGAVTGGLAGILYGYSSIPIDWINVLARKDEIKKLAEQLLQKYH